MSTFLVSFGVVAATIAAVVYVVLNGPDQPATIRRQPSRAKDRRGERAARAQAKSDNQARHRATTQTQAAPPPPPPFSASPPTPPSTPPSTTRAPLAMATSPALALPDSDVMRLRVLAAKRTTLWVRLRSAVALVVLVAVLGALVALAIGGFLLGLALLVRSATG